MSQKEDQHYIDAVINGDTRAFSVLVERYKHMVFTVAVKVLKNQEEAEEVAQDVFVKAYTALSTFKGDSKFSTWIYKIAYYRSLDYLKKQKRGMRTSSIDSGTEYHLSSMQNALDNLEINERKLAIKDAIDELPKDDAVVITLHYFEELSLKEIADIMNLEANTVKVRLFRSRKRLAELLKSKLEPEILGSYGRK
ncbi:sigma-70 family RNA polymerase sigma factor [Maribacter algarum]|uniref:RNA polymerase sigma factor n=1 Tax=Maribacter algarum (ex Zhang et al. 2020) TaxID=2578118 RepID=A0A5S3QFF7_9FLAO|nr:sigma-70 family RNA polymerase sigma factor [Maribacter algarum]TMM56007.1 sigma-70 family RNA polymerase sigma factor [Maribacter algarum]